MKSCSKCGTSTDEVATACPKCGCKPLVDGTGQIETPSYASMPPPPESFHEGLLFLMGQAARKDGFVLRAAILLVAVASCAIGWFFGLPAALGVVVLGMVAILLILVVRAFWIDEGKASHGSARLRYKWGIRAGWVLAYIGIGLLHPPRFHATAAMLPSTGQTSGGAAEQVPLWVAITLIAVALYVVELSARGCQLDEVRTGVSDSGK